MPKSTDSSCLNAYAAALQVHLYCLQREWATQVSVALAL